MVLRLEITWVSHIHSRCSKAQSFYIHAPFSTLRVYVREFQDVNCDQEATVVRAPMRCGAPIIDRR